VLTIDIGVAVKNEKPCFFTYLLIKLTLFSIKEIALILLADKSLLCVHGP
jgi:hypothetical protein